MNMSKERRNEISYMPIKMVFLTINRYHLQLKMTIDRYLANQILEIPLQPKIKRFI